MTENSSMPDNSLLPISFTLSDYLTLWLNYENKIEALRSRFLTIAGLLFTLQSGVFVLLVDKIADDKGFSWSLFSAEILLVIISMIIYRFLSIITDSYTKHIDNNVQRSANTVKESKDKFLDLKGLEGLKERIEKSPKVNSSNQVSQDQQDSQSATYVIKQTQCIYRCVCGLTNLTIVVHIISLILGCVTQSH